MQQKVRNSSRRTTLGDIAKRANVSIAAVSIILNGKHQQYHFSDDLVTKVKAIAVELDYAPNLLVKSMQQGHTKILTFYNTYRRRSHGDDYLDRVLTAFEMAGIRYGYDILISCIFSGSADDTYRRLNGGYSDGVILYGPRADEPLLPYLRSSRLPVVVANRIDQEGVLSHVKDDLAGGMQQVADRLYALGHRRVVAFTTSPRISQTAGERVGLLRAYLAERGIPIPDSHVMQVNEGGGDGISPEAALQSLMSEPAPPTAIFCWHDRLGYLVLDQCEQMGINVPEHLSLIGYDGLRPPTQTRHMLASVTVDLDMLADASVSLLHQLIAGEVSAPVGCLFPVTFGDGTTLTAAATS